VQTCIWPSGFHCHSLSLASVKSRLVLPFWYRLTWVVPDKGPLNGCVCITFAVLWVYCCDSGEVLRGDRIVNTPYNVSFLFVFCTKLKLTVFSIQWHCLPSDCSVLMDSCIFCYSGCVSWRLSFWDVLPKSLMGCRNYRNCACSVSGN